jgi:subtilase family serine protease
MVPDVAADADPNTGYNIVLHGAPMAIGGTSAVAPLYAGLIAAFGTKLGWITPQLYQNQVCFNDITQGDNGKYRADRGPDPCTGLGSPIGTKLAELLTHPAATPMRRLKDVEAENERLRQEIARLMAK